jgi:RNA polymerase sigma-70 factor (ECF subfamily)
VTDKEFEQFISTTRWVVLSAIRKYLHPRLADYVDDVAQETYIRIFRYFSNSGFPGDKDISLGNWVYTIAKNESLRMNTKQDSDLKLNLDSSESIDFIEDKRSWEKSLLDKWEYKSILDSIPEPFKEVLELSLAGKKGNQISKELNISEGTVKSRLFRAKKIAKENRK